MFDASHPVSSAASSLESDRGGLAPWQAKRVAGYIETNINSNLRVAELARSVQLSAAHFCRKFRQSFGETPHAYITRQRMHRAQLIMLSSRQPLSQIALDCGMFDQAHFTRVFRRLVGINPSLWRRQFPLGDGGADSEFMSTTSHTVSRF